MGHYDDIRDRRDALKNIKKLDPNSKEYKEEALSLIWSYAPRAYPCKKCTHPVINGYRCKTCGTGTPEWTVEQEDEFERKHARK